MICPAAGRWAVFTRSVPSHDLPGSGYRAVPHTADLRIEAWGPTLQECLTAAVRGLIASFAEVPAGEPGREVTVALPAGSAEDLLVAALDEVIYRMDADGEIPLAATARGCAGGGTELVLRLVPVATAELVGAVPKAVALSGLRCAPDAAGRWSASVTIDV